MPVPLLNSLMLWASDAWLCRVCAQQWAPRADLTSWVCLGAVDLLLPSMGRERLSVSVGSYRNADISSLGQRTCLTVKAIRKWMGHPGGNEPPAQLVFKHGWTSPGHWYLGDGWMGTLESLPKWESGHASPPLDHWLRPRAHLRPSVNGPGRTNANLSISKRRTSA